MKRLGRPPIGDENMVHVTFRVPVAVLEAYRSKTNRSTHLRKALEAYMLTDEFKKDKPSS
jgi:hypothetical protein